MAVSRIHVMKRCITVTLHERYGVSNNRQRICLPNSLFRKKYGMISQFSWLFARGSHRWLVDSPHNEPVMRKAFPFHDVMKVNRIWWLYRSTLVEVIETINSANWPLGSGIIGSFKWTGNHTYLGLRNNWGMQSKNGLRNLWGNIVFFILC